MNVRVYKQNQFSENDEPMNNKNGGSAVNHISVSYTHLICITSEIGKGTTVAIGLEHRDIIHE